MNDLVVSVNGDPMTVPEGSMISDVVARLLEGAPPKGIAVAVDLEVDPPLGMAHDTGSARGADRGCYRGGGRLGD